MKSGFRSDIGRQRKNNEDSYFVDEKMGLFIVADGMGGHRGGSAASGMAVSLVSRYLKDNMPKSPDREVIYKTLLDAAYMANDQIKAVAGKEPELSGMGTTIVVTLTYEDTFYVLSIGDSRAYLIRGGEMRQLTEDHSLVAHMVKQGMITPEEAKVHQMRNIVTQALGSGEFITPDIRDHQWDKDDYLLLCTDGLTEMVEEGDIAGTIKRFGKDPEKACESLVRKANKNGGKDNVTVILLYKN